MDELVAFYKSLIGDTIEGYKGGTYKITEDTHVWVANSSGDCTGTIIVNIRDLSHGTAILETEYED